MATEGIHTTSAQTKRQSNTHFFTRLIARPQADRTYKPPFRSIQNYPRTVFGCQGRPLFLTPESLDELKARQRADLAAMDSMLKIGAALGLVAIAIAVALLAI